MFMRCDPDGDCNGQHLRLKCCSFDTITSQLKLTGFELYHIDLFNSRDRLPRIFIFSDLLTRMRVFSLVASSKL